MEDFGILFKKFKNGVDLLSGMKRTPFYARELKRFNKEIVEPMDMAWLRLSQVERDGFNAKL